MNFSHVRYRLIILTNFFTFKKFFNLFLNFLEYKLKRSVLLSGPRSLNLELLNYCNLRCVACPTHVYSSKRKKRFLRLEKFEEVINKTEKLVYNFAIGGNGEITLIPGIEKYLSLAKEKRLFVCADTNFNCSRETIKRIYEAGINMVNISLDGINQGSYGKYRKGGNFQRVFDNMVCLISLKRKNRSFFPRVQWQYIVNRYNEGEVGKARKVAKELGVDEFRTELPFVPGGDHYFFEDYRELVNKISGEFSPRGWQYGIKNRVALLGCYQPFSELQVLCNGDIIPCCRLREKNIILGNIINEPLGQIWNNQKFIFFRKQLIEQGNSPHCAVCYQNMINYLKA